LEDAERPRQGRLISTCWETAHAEAAARSRCRLPRPRIPVPVLRRPHDHHGDFRAAATEVPPHAAGGNQDRHLMMPSPSIYTYGNARHSYRLLAGIAQARIAALHSIAVARPIQSRHPQVARSHRPMRPSFAASRSRQPLQSNLSKPEPAANPHSARRSAPAYFPRLRALALFGRRPPQRVDSLVVPASEKLHISRNARLQTAARKANRTSFT
jgi:hypothetical protein